MRGVLFNSPIYRDRSEVNEEYLPPLGLGYIATHLEKSGVTIEIVDCVKDHLGISEIFKLLKQQNPDFIGINIFTQNYEIVKEIVESCPIKTEIFIGGQVVKCIYEKILQWKLSNKLVIVIGEGEHILPALINRNCTALPYVKIEGKEVYKVDKNSHYFPNDLGAVHINRKVLKDYISVNHYGQKEASIITSRGCMYNCAFCGGAHNLNQDVTIRYRPVFDIIKEIEEIISFNSDITSIRVLDDLFLRDAESINNAALLFRKFSSLSWRGMAHVLTFVKNLELLPLLKQSNCNEIFMGIESGSEHIRKRINKPGTIEQIIKVVSAILECGIDIKGYFMFGFPDETTIEADATYLLASRLNDIATNTIGNFRTSVFQFRPYHGTQLYDEIIKSGREISMISSNTALNIQNGRSQFNFHSGNYSQIDDNILNEYIIKTQKLSEVSNA